MNARYSTSYRQQARLVRSNLMLVWVVILTAALIYLPWVMTSHSIFGLHLTRHELLNMNMTQINYTLIYIVGALGLNLLTGYTGLISIGNAAFYAIGAMVAASIGIKWLQLPFLVVVLAAGIAGAIVGAVVGLPALRIRGIYLLLGTLALQFIVSYLFLKFQAAYFGIVGVIFSYPSIGGWKLDNDKSWYFFLLGFAVLALFLVKNILRTRHGRAFVAVRDHPIAASAAGINVSYVRVAELLDLVVHRLRLGRHVRLVPRRRHPGQLPALARDRVHRDDRDRRRGLAGRHRPRRDALDAVPERADRGGRDGRRHLAVGQ